MPGKSKNAGVPEARGFPTRHERMMKKAMGVVFYSAVHLAGIPNAKPDAVSSKGRLMFSKEICKYIGCSLRHFYWLAENQGFPFYGFPVGDNYRYVAYQNEIDQWLNNYRGKGKQLGLLQAQIHGWSPEKLEQFKAMRKKKRRRS